MALLDIDLWHRDDLDPESFSIWPAIYHKASSPELKVEFVRSEQFALYLKGMMTISTFDEEDPQYPDHKNFFLTPDHLLLIEYEESYPYVEELQSLLRIFYSEVGVENAYTHLFKIVADSFTIFQEEQYLLKKNRLRDYGLIDYYDALEMLAPMNSMGQVENFISSRGPSSGKVDALLKNQVSIRQAVAAYQEKFDSIHQELSQITSSERMDFLHFNFLLFINATLGQRDAFKKSGLAIGEAGREGRFLLLLGLSHLKSLRNFGEQSALAVFDFLDLYRIGVSLLNIQRTLLKSALAKNGFDRLEREAFLGGALQQLIEDSFRTPPLGVEDHRGFERWRADLQCLGELLPFISQFHASYQSLQEQGAIRDDYYLNYRVAEIDFETLLLSSFINFELGHYSREQHDPKMGITVDELKTFCQKYFSREQYHCESFFQRFAMDKVSGIENYLKQLLEHHLAGQDFSSLPDSDFAHVGGPILLKG